MKKLFVLILSLVMVALLPSSTPASAQRTVAAWKPSGPISLIVCQGPGGGFDAWGRVIGMALTKYVGVPVVIKNVPGLGGATGVETIWRSKPDGQTIVIFEGGAMLATQYLLGVSFDVHRLTFIGNVNNGPFAIFVSNTSPYNSIQDFVSAGRTKTLLGGTTGLASGLWQSMAIFAKEARIDVRPVPGYQSGGGMLVGLGAGDFDAMFIPPQAALAMIKRGSVKALAVAGTARDPRLPDTPTFAEAGFPQTGIFATVMRTLAAPPNTPPHITAFLEKAFLAAMSDAKFLEWLKSQQDFIDPLNGKQTIELFKRQDKTIKDVLPILKQYVK